MELKMKDIMSEQEWKASGLTCLAARPAMGKTALAIELALDAARWMEKKIVWFSLEMNEKSLTRRLENRVGAGAEELQNIEIDDTPAISVEGVERKLQMVQDVGLVVIDYLRLMIEKQGRLNRDREEEIRRIVQGLSRISREQQVPVLVLSQLPRKVDYRVEKRPCLEDIHIAGGAEYYDHVIFLYREAYYRGIEYREDIPDDSAEIILAKSQSGSPRTIPARFDNERLCFWRK